MANRKADSRFFYERESRESRSRDTRKAHVTMTRAVRAEPNNPKRIKKLVFTMILAGRAREAIQMADRTLPITGSLHRELSASLFRRGYASEGFEVLHKTLEKEEDKFWVLTQLGAWYNECGKYEIAISMLDKTFGLYAPRSDIVESFLIMSDSYEGVDDRKSAVSYVHEALRLLEAEDASTKIEDASKWRYLCYYRLARLSEHQDVAQHYIDLALDEKLTAEALFLKGYLLYADGKKKRSYIYWNTVSTINTEMIIEGNFRLSEPFTPAMMLQIIIELQQEFPHVLWGYKAREAAENRKNHKLDWADTWKKFQSPFTENLQCRIEWIDNFILLVNQSFF
jgi:tetratricopeptide (TPR) repeat protein